MFNKLSKRIRKLFNSSSSQHSREERTRPRTPPKVPPRPVSKQTSKQVSRPVSKPQASKQEPISKPQSSTSSEVHKKKKRVRHIVSDSDSDSDSSEHKTKRVSRPQASTSSEHKTKKKRVRHIVSDSDFIVQVRREKHHVPTKSSSDGSKKSKTNKSITTTTKKATEDYHRFVKNDFRFFNARNCSMFVKLVKVTDGDTFTVAFPVKLNDLMKYYSSTEHYFFERVNMEKDEYAVLYFIIRSKGIDAYEKDFLPGQLATAYAYHILSPLEWIDIHVGNVLPDKYGRVLASINSGNKNLESCLLKGYNDLQTICRKALSQLKPYDKRLRKAKEVNFSDYDSWNKKPLAVPYDGGAKDIKKVKKSSEADKTIYNAMILAIEKKCVYQLETTLKRNKTRVKGVRNL